MLTQSLPDTVHVVYVARGGAVWSGATGSLVQSVHRATANVRHAAGAACAPRLRFHVLTEGASYADVRNASDLLGEGVRVHESSDATLLARLSPLGRAYLRHPLLRGKAHLYTAPKLFAYELLPRSVDRAIMLDFDQLVLRPLCELHDAFGSALARPGRELVVVGYAHEQQNEYAIRHGISHGATSNGGVAVHELRRMRVQGGYAELLRKALATGLGELGPDAGLGDQSVLTLAAARWPAEWASLAETLPCEWNWQACLFWYYRVLHHPMYLHLRRAPKPGGLNASAARQCARPPKILHVNCMDKAALVTALLAHALRAAERGDCDALSRPALVALLDRQLRTAHAPKELVLDASRLCALTAPLLPERRVCNASFLLHHYVPWAPPEGCRDPESSREVTQ